VTPDQIDGGFAPMLRPSVVAEEIDGDVVLYDEATRAVHVLNGTAAVIAASFDGRATVAEIAGELADHYGASPDAVHEGVLDVARRLATESLVVGIEGGVPGAPAAPAAADASGPTWLVDPPAR
jgi:hypothetical protein